MPLRSPHVLIILGLWMHPNAATHWNTELHSAVQRGEYCYYEVFEADCGSNSSVIIGKALYGQMGIGKCVDFDTGYLGCQADVTDIVRARCHGKQQCILPADDEALRSTEPCRRGVQVYLEVSYLCTKAIPLRESCDDVQANETTKYISGAGNCNFSEAIHVSAKPGQTVVFSVINLLALFHTEQDLKQRVAIVTSDSETFELTSLVDEAMTKNSSASLVMEDRTGLVLVGFKSAGCADVTLGADKWLERKAEFMLVGCHGEQMNWRMVCVDGEWHGHVGNCTTEITAAKIDKVEPPSQLQLPMEVILMITGCLTLIIIVIVITIGCLCYRRPWHPKQNDHCEPTATYELVESRRSSTDNQLVHDERSFEERTYIIQKTEPLLVRTPPPPRPPDIRRYELLTIPRMPTSNLTGSHKSSTDSLDDRSRYSAPGSPYLNVRPV
ncbi:hypothetical protein CAPTEDRAFT_217448 [Capitella teleta]|uniref:SUEL-type lectin domain-containing protein n=1 Tax=Capitella teleta TaxID=283909 RepID=R7UGF6_CAPTE|nr:hypothetical protein CAPTEDRAFT_217448 [Capitella teleta]|eukprot:ELU05604.1 hypothetical protein CAPTEDRAFT_217448 [Capitella teleta]